MEKDEPETTEQTFVGNGKKVDMSTNCGVLRVVGNNCFVTVTKNEGSIVITGNRGHLQVTQNLGSICYTGNKGLVEVGSTFKGIGQVIYTGSGGVVRKMKKSGSGRRSSTKHHDAKKEGRENKNVQSGLIVNGVEACINPKSKQSATKENVNSEKLKETSSVPPPSSCCHEARKFWCGTYKKGGHKTTTIHLSHQRNIEVVNLPNFRLENWCLNLATELVAL